jgi:hypothetical protein
VPGSAGGEGSRIEERKDWHAEVSWKIVWQLQPVAFARCAERKIGLTRAKSGLRVLTMPAALADVEISDIVFGSIMLLAIVVAGAYFAMWLRRRIWGSDDDGIPVPPSGFTLGDLRQLHKNGQLSDAEFERAKEKVVESAKRAMLAKPVGRQKQTLGLDQALGGRGFPVTPLPPENGKPPESDSADP